MEACVLLKFGELALKGKNRWRFVAQLRRNVRRAVRGLGGVELQQRAGVLALRPAGDAEELLERCLDVIGVNVVHPAVSVERSVEAAAAAAVELTRGLPGETFAVRARRRDKRFPVRSRELASVVGQAVRSELGLQVDLGDPDVEVHLEVDEREIFVYTRKLPGRGGLPVGISGRALVLLSGGIDSPVAAYRAMRRGLRCDFVHFSGRPYTGPESMYKAYAHVGRLDRFQGESRLFVVPFGHAQRALASAKAGRLQVLAQRRMMVRVASALARRDGADALVTGDSLGQVASQTLPNLAVVEQAAEVPLLRPLVDRDKSEIVEEAQALGTYEISTLPDEDCCQLFATKLAETRGDPQRLSALERLVDVEELVDALVAAAEVFRPVEERRATLAPVLPR